MIEDPYAEHRGQNQRRREADALTASARATMRQLIDALPESLRQPLVLSAIEEMTSREVAIAMGIPEGTVRTRIMRARTELKRRFEAGRLQRKPIPSKEGTPR